jgi:hypothetical protein
MGTLQALGRSDSVAYRLPGDDPRPTALATIGHYTGAFLGVGLVMIVPAWPIVGGLIALPILILGLILESTFLLSLYMVVAMSVWAAIVVGLSFHFAFENVWRFLDPRAQHRDNRGEVKSLVVARESPQGVISALIAILPAIFWLTTAFLLFQDAVVHFARGLAG